MMNRDAHGNEMSGDRDAVARYDAALDLLLRYHPDVVEQATEQAEAGDVPMASAMFAYLHLLSTEPEDLPVADAAHRALAATAATPREHAHSAAIGAWLHGDWHGAAQILDDLLVEWPTDLLALLFGHQLDFFTGNAASLRDRPARTLRVLDHPHLAFVRGMAAFGFEESGHYGEALELGLAAVAARPDDVWGVHAVVHTHEMQGRVDEGIAFMRSDATRWKDDNLLAVHNWWHLALYELEVGRHEAALAIYDAAIHHAGSEAVSMEMLDASALLWRLYLDGLDTGDRFGLLADRWAEKSPTPWYAFNDAHAAMAFAGAGRIGEAAAVADRLASWLTTEDPHSSPSNRRFTAEVGLPVTRAVVAFAQDRHDDVVAELMPIRRSLATFGGSHAQRDAFQRTLLESALRSERHTLAAALTAERLGGRDTSVYAWTQRSRALAGLGDPAGAAAAITTADTHRARFATG